MNDRLNVLSPLVIGQHTLKNRIVFGPHRANFAVANRPGDRHVSYFEERARGGAALIVVEGGVVHPSDYPYENAIFAFKKETETGYRRIAEAAHRYGSLVAAQLNHYGGQATGGLSRREVWAPSPFPEVNTGEVPKAMEEEDIREVVEGFADCAARLCGLGLDGVEINAGQNSLLRQFLSPLTNFRTDAYGGSLENRARFCREVLEAVRRAAGPGPIVGLRICGDEYAPWGGLKPEDSRDLVLHLCGGGLVDYVAVEVGSIYSLHLTAASMRYPEDYAVPPARLMAQSLTVPVCAAGSVVSLELAESLLAEGIQLVEMTRALIADPYLPVRSGCGEGEIRPCILCNQGCFVHWEMNPKLTCTVNPRAGREGEMPVSGKPAARSKKVLVAGAGPAGLEAACTAAERGHGVVVYDRRDRPGGRLGLAAKVPGCGRFQNIIDFLYHRALSLGVRFHFGRPADQSAVASESAEAVIAATGSLPSPLPFPVEPGVDFLISEDILEGSGTVGRRVLLVDLEGGRRAVGTALGLAGRVVKLEFLSPELLISPELVPSGEFVHWYREAYQKGIVFRPQLEIVRATPSGLEVIGSYSRKPEHLKGFDTLVAVVPPTPCRGFYEDLQRAGVEVWAAGDCVAPRGLGSAIREGRIAGLKI